MMTATHPLAPVRDELQKAVAGDESALADLLRRRTLPPLGGSEEAADVIARALSLLPVDPDLIGSLASPLSTLIAAEADTLEQQTPSEDSSSQPGVIELEDGDGYLFNLFLLAEMLAPDPELFAALCRLHELHLSSATFPGIEARIPRQLRRALLFLQTDDRLESFWFGRLEPAHATGEVQSDLEVASFLQAFQALLWIPPSAEARERAETVNLPRIEKALIALAEALKSHPESRDFLRFALRQVADAYPRDQAFWSKAFASAFPYWPKALQETAPDQWPDLGVLRKLVAQTTEAEYSPLQPSQLADEGQSRPIPEKDFISSADRLRPFPIHSSQDNQSSGRTLNRRTSLPSRPRQDWSARWDLRGDTARPAAALKITFAALAAGLAGLLLGFILTWERPSRPEVPNPDIIGSDPEKSQLAADIRTLSVSEGTDRVPEATAESGHRSDSPQTQDTIPFSSLIPGRVVLLVQDSQNSEAVARAARSALLSSTNGLSLQLHVVADRDMRQLPGEIFSSGADTELTPWGSEYSLFIQSSFEDRPQQSGLIESVLLTLNAKLVRSSDQELVASARETHAGAGGSQEIALTQAAERCLRPVVDYLGRR